MSNWSARTLAPGMHWTVRAILSVAIVGNAWSQDGDTGIRVVDSPLRTWTSSDGKFTVEARLIEIAAGGVRLETAERKSIKVDVARLSAQDHQFIESARSRAVGAEDSHLAPGAAESGAAPETPARFAEGVGLKPSMADVPASPLQSTHMVSMSSGKWQKPPSRPVKSFQVPVPSIHTRVTAFGCNRDDGLFAVSFSDLFGAVIAEQPAAGKGTKGTRRPGAGQVPSVSAEGAVKSWVDLVSLADGKSRGRFALPNDHTQVGDIHPSGGWILAFDGAYETDPQVMVLEIQASAAPVRLSWHSTNERGHPNGILAARFLANGHVVTAHRDRLVVWNTDPLEPRFVVENQASEWKLAPDRRHATATVQRTMFEVDLCEGVCTGVFSGGAPSGDSNSIVSNDGSRVVSFRPRVITVADANGELIDEFDVPLLWPNSQLSWADEQTLQVNSSASTFYVDLANRVVLLEVVSAAPQTASSQWQTTMQQSAKGRFLLVSREVTDRQDIDWAGLRAKLPAKGDGLLLLRPGDRVRLAYQLAADPGELAAADQRIRELLAARQVVIDDSAPDVLMVRSSTAMEDVEYRASGAVAGQHGNVAKVNVRTTSRAVEFVRDGVVMFSFTSGAGPSFLLEIRPGETAQQAAERESRAGSGIWQSITLPKHVAMHPGGQPWRRLMVTRQGVVELK
jgi:hypothetical protein